MTLTEKIVAVVGSTGVQGGSVVRTLLNDGTFAVRALTRDVNKAQDLKDLGAEVVAADAEDVESLKKAFRGAWGVFGVTDCKRNSFAQFLEAQPVSLCIVWTLLPIHGGNQAETQAHEEQYGRNLVDAAEAEGVQHFVTLPHIEAYTVYHFASKVTVENYLRSKKVPFSVILTSAYYSNLTRYGLLRREGDGFIVALGLPSTSKVPSFDAHEIGSWVLVALKSEPTGKTYNACGEILTPLEYAEALSRVSGKTVKVQEVTPTAFRSKEHIQKLGNELWLNMKSIYEGLFIQDLKKSREENPNAKTFEEFAKTDPELKECLGY
ncbi:hypothetical protein BS47DRAFT_49340 [Hydnum rufescens UP504]|uniref:NmrA-like domain-containing protein n=1 Tax=Hydnum rufescens UP504 TaxID=1448309 RepID=A0A9P6AS40_9AGAM|nr:hypothetical protein BS47DRAFT_49340 [Hydnum rufescens UP504]